MDVIDELITHCEAWEPWARVMGNVCAGDAAQALRNLRAELETEESRRHEVVRERNALRAELAEMGLEQDRLKQYEIACVVLTEEADGLRAELAECKRLLRRYRTETVLGHQPHMIAHEVDAALAAKGE